MGTALGMSMGMSMIKGGISIVKGMDTITAIAIPIINSWRGFTFSYLFPTSKAVKYKFTHTSQQISKCQPTKHPAVLPPILHPSSILSF